MWMSYALSPMTMSIVLCNMSYCPQCYAMSYALCAMCSVWCFLCWRLRERERERERSIYWYRPAWSVRGSEAAGGERGERSVVWEHRPGEHLALEHWTSWQARETVRQSEQDGVSDQPHRPGLPRPALRDRLLSRTVCLRPAESPGHLLPN